MKIPVELEGKEIRNGYFDSIDYAAIQHLSKIATALENAGAEIVSCSLVNAYQRKPDHGYLEDSLIPATPKSWIGFTYRGHICSVAFEHFWIFEGVSVSAYPVVDGVWYNTKYRSSFQLTEEPDWTEKLIAVLLDPASLYASMETIRVARNGRQKASDLEYVSRKRFVERTFYTF